MDVSKLKNPPFPASLAFGAGGPENTLNMTLDPDVVTEQFLIDMDSSARKVFNSTIASIRLALKHQTAPPPLEQPSPVPGSRRPRKPTKKQLAAAVAKQASKELDIDALSELIPKEDESWLLAQASECTYMAEALARVVLEWDLTNNGVPVAITAVRDFPCCKEAGSDCRHASDFLRARPREILRKLFKFVMFEAQAPEKKVNTPSEPT